jgi:predicted ester cyclase
VPATGKEARVRLYVVYELEDEQIKQARVYFDMPVLMQQLGVQMGAG